MDTFVQQLIQTENRDLGIPDSNAFLLRSQRYDGYSQVDDDDGSIQPEGMHPDMSGAVYTALYSTSLPDPDAFQCPESNCTYPITPTLAMCGKCHDLSSEIISTDALPGGGYLLQQGPELSGNVYMNMTSTVNASETNSFTDLNAMVVSFAWINTTNTVGEQPTAGECALYPCVQEIQGDVTRGRLNETVVREWTYVAPRPITNDTSVALGIWSYYMDIKVDTEGMDGPAAAKDFNFSIKSFLSMREAIPPLLQGNMWGGSNSVEEGLYYSSTTMQTLYFTPDMNDLIDRLSTSMTMSIRRNPAPYVMPPYGNITENTPNVPFPIPEYPGESVRQVIFIHIVWPWITLPAITVLFSNLFLIYAMVRTKQARKVLDIGIWRSSSLPILYHGLHADVLTRANLDPALSTSVAYLEENANQLRVRLNLVGDQIKLS